MPLSLWERVAERSEPGEGAGRRKTLTHRSRSRAVPPLPEGEGLDADRKMGWLTGIVVYVLVWWVTLFAILPLWVTPAEPEEGHDPAPRSTPISAASWR